MSESRTIIGIPHDSLADGITHGPYPAAPTELVDLYITRHLQYPDIEPAISEDQKRADIESEWQYDQHSEAVMAAFESGRISQAHAKFMTETILRPWFIGHRNPGQ